MVIFIGGVAAAPKVLAYEASYSDTGSGVTHTHAAADLGTPAADRRIIVTYAFSATGGGTAVPTMTINSVSATLIGSAQANANWQTGIFIAHVPSDATGDIVIDHDGAGGLSGQNSYINVYSVTGLTSNTPIDWDEDESSEDPSLTVTTVSGGFVVGAAAHGGTGTTWTNATEDNEFANMDGTSNDFASASEATSGSSLTVTATYGGSSGSTHGFILASW